MCFIRFCEKLLLYFIVLALFREPAVVSVDDREPVKILILLPFFDTRVGSGWDKGIELLPGARIARDEINQQKDMLPGYMIELIEESSDACGHSLTRNAIVNFAHEGIGRNGSGDVLGVAGLACSSVTAAVSSLAGRTEVNLLQLSFANSPVFNDNTKYARLWRVQSSSIAFVNATLALMDMLNWSRVAAVYDERSVYFANTALDLVKRVVLDPSKTNVVKSTVDVQSVNHIHSVLSQIQSKVARIIFVSATAYEISSLLCHAYVDHLVWPGYVWIIHTHTLQEILSSSPPCEQSMLLSAIENAILLNWNLEPISLDAELISGQTYGQLKDKYLQELYKLSQEERFKQYKDLITFANQVYAYPVYDEIWTLAVALNQSISELAKKNISLSDITYRESDITDTIEKYLKDVSFQGAASYIKFNSHHETETSINMIQIINGEEIVIGKYELQNLILSSNAIHNFPSDNFEIVYQKLHKAGTYTFLILIVAVVFFVTLTLFFVLFYSKSPNIKADSPPLSLLIFCGCYTECISATLEVILISFIFDPEQYTIIYITVLWSSIVGIDVILSTIAVRLARIYRIFTHFGRTGKAWRDWALFIYVIVLNIFPNALMILWVSINPPEYHVKSIFYLEQNPPYVEYIEELGHNTIWITVQIVYSAMLISIILFLSVQTRKIKSSKFKDTKKLNFLVYTLVILLSFILIIRQILIALDFDLYGRVVFACGVLTICILCQVFLFIPKVLPVLFEHIRTGSFKKVHKRKKKHVTFMVQSVLTVSYFQTTD